MLSSMFRVRSRRDPLVFDAAEAERGAPFHLTKYQGNCSWQKRASSSDRSYWLTTELAQFSIFRREQNNKVYFEVRMIMVRNWFSGLI